MCLQNLLWPIVILRDNEYSTLSKTAKSLSISHTNVLPLALYSQTIGFDLPVGTLVQVLLVNGILYHLWYFPALITGSLLLTSLLIHVSFKKCSGLRLDCT